MTVIANNVMGISRYEAINELVIVWIALYQIPSVSWLDNVHVL